MPAPDDIHEAVKEALVRDGWQITQDPYTIRYEEVLLFADLGAQRPMSVSRGNRNLVVEAKSFLGPSPMHDFKLTLGQFLLYRAYLDETSPDHELFLAIDESVYDSLFRLKAIELVLRRYQISLLVVDVVNCEVRQWIRGKTIPN